MNEKKYSFKCHLSCREDGSSASLVVYLAQNMRMRIPLNSGIIERCGEDIIYSNDPESCWIEDNLATVELQAKDKGLV